jgi:hypothetical protein
MYTLTNTNTLFGIKSNNINDYKKLSKAIKIHLKRNNISVNDILLRIGINLYKCSWCNNDNNAYYLICDIDSNMVTIKGIDYNFLNKLKAKFVCHLPKCEYHNLNPNSIDFISRAYGVSEDDAKIYLHKRSKSPFYKENHIDQAQYKLTQSVYSLTDKSAATIKANFSRSLEGYIDRYGEDLGTSRWLDINKRKINSIDNYQLSGLTIQDSIQKYNDWIFKTTCSKESYIQKYGNFNGPIEYIKRLANYAAISTDTISNQTEVVKFISDKIENDPLSVCIDYPLQSKLDNNTLITELIKKYNITYELIENTLKNRGYGYKSLIGKKLGKFGIMSWTKDGILLRSSAEYRFYQKLLTLHLDKLHVKIDTWYPCKKFKFDFFFPELEIYIEIAGMCNLVSYKLQLEKKITQYNCLVAYNYYDQDIILEKVRLIAIQKGLL